MPDPLILIAGGLALVGMTTTPENARAADDPDGWVWPLVTHPDGRPPVISDGWGSPRDGGGRTHAGVDVMYKRSRTLSADEWRAMSIAQRAHNSRGFEVPAGTVVVAARAGRVWSTGRGERGIHVTLDHGKPWATFYQHLETLAIHEHVGGKRAGGGAPQEVEAGTVLGTVGYSSVDAASIRHLHFAVYKGGGSDHAIDPGPMMRGWRVIK